MFERNDKALLTAGAIIKVFIGIIAILSLVMGIILAVLVHAALFLIIFGGWFICWLIWIFARLYLSYLCDIKLIRNKLYGESNEGLADFLKTYKEQIAELEKEERKSEEVEEKLAHHYQLFMEGKITEEEYKEYEEELTKEK